MDGVSVTYQWRPPLYADVMQQVLRVTSDEFQRRRAPVGTVLRGRRAAAAAAAWWWLSGRRVGDELVQEAGKHVRATVDPQHVRAAAFHDLETLGPEAPPPWCIAAATADASRSVERLQTYTSTHAYQLRLMEFNYRGAYDLWRPQRPLSRPQNVANRTKSAEQHSTFIAVWLDPLYKVNRRLQCAVLACIVEVPNMT